MGPMLWNPEKPCTSTIGYGRWPAGPVSWPVGHSVGLGAGSPAPGVGAGAGTPPTLPLQPRRATLPKQARKALVSAHFIAFRPPTAHLRALDIMCQVADFVVLFTHRVNYMS